MRTVSFYSYKGGTGRTLLVANLAVFGARLGYRVVMVDLDLEAPGLPYKFPSALPGGPPEGPGVLEWLTADRRPTLAELTHPIPLPSVFRPGGSLQLICAGGRPSRDYLKAMRNLQNGPLAGTSDDVIASFIMLRDAVANELEPDLLLLDARTGITTTNAITTRVLADDVVALTLNAPEQLDGTREVLRSLVPLNKPAEATPLGLYVVISRMQGRTEDAGTYELSRIEQAAKDEVSEFLTEPAVPLATTLTHPDILLLHNDVDVAEQEEILLARDDALTSVALHLDYLRVADALLGDDLPDRIDAALDSAKSDAQRRGWARFFQRTDVLAELDARPNIPETWLETVGAPRANTAERVAMLRSLVRTDISRRPALADELAHLGVLQQGAGEPEKAIASLEEAVRLYQELRKGRSDDAYLQSHIQALDLLADVYKRGGRQVDSLRAAAEAYHVANVNRDRPEFRGELLAKAAARYGLSLAESGDLRAAVDRLREGISALRLKGSLHVPVSSWKLLETRGDVRNQLARMLGSLSTFDLHLGSLEEGLLAAQRATEIWQALAADDIKYQETYARSLNNLGNYFRVLGRYGEAEDAMRSASNIFRQLSADDPSRYLDGLATTLEGLAAVDGDLGRHNKALATAEEALHFRRDLLDADRDAHRVGLASALNNVAAQYGSLDQSAEAADRAAEAISLLREIAEHTPQTYELLGAALNNLSLSSVRLGRIDQALRAALDAVEIYRRISDADSPWHRAETARALLNLSLIYARSDAVKEALVAAEQAVEIAQSLDSEAPSQYADLHANALNALGMRQLRSGDIVPAISSARQAAGKYQELARTEPDRYLPRVAGALEALATGLDANNQAAEAESVRQEAQEIFKRALRRPSD